MREIKFRAQGRDSDEWYYGYFLERNGEAIILDPNTGEEWYVRRETVGERTGVKDKKGNDIYEGMNVTWKVGTIRVNGKISYSESYGVWVKGQSQNIGSYQKTTEILEDV